MENIKKMEDINQMTKNTPLMSYDSKHQICDSTLYFTAFMAMVEQILTYAWTLGQLKLGEHQEKCRALL